MDNQQTETIYEILKTPVENLKKDQVEFMEQVLEINHESKIKPWAMFGSIMGFAATFGGTLALLALPFSIFTTLAYIGGAIASIGCTQLVRKSSYLADYSKIGTNKFSFEEFQFEGGIEQIQNKLEEFYNFETEQLLKDIQSYCESFDEPTHKKRVVKPEEKTEDKTIEDNNNLQL